MKNINKNKSKYKTNMSEINAKIYKFPIKYKIIKKPKLFKKINLK